MNRHVGDESLAELRKQHANGAIAHAMDAFHLVVGLLERRSSVEEGLRAAEALKGRFPLVGEAVATFAYGAPPFYDKPRPECVGEWISWMRVGAASEGEAAILLGNYLVDTEDYAGAMTAYEQGVAIGSAENAFAIGYLYEEGQGVPRDLVKACEWFMRAGKMDWNGWLTTDVDSVPVDENGVWRDQELLASYLSDAPPEDKQRILAAVHPKEPWPSIVRLSGTPLFSRVMMYGQSPEWVWLDDGTTLFERGNALAASRAPAHE